MSYIRSISTPEKLYIWGDTRNVFIAEGDNNDQHMPQQVFEGLLRTWLHAFENDELDAHEHVKYDQASLTFEKVGKDFKWVFEYQDIKFNMWYSTLYYLVYSNAYRWEKMQ